VQEFTELIICQHLTHAVLKTYIRIHQERVKVSFLVFQ